MKKTRRSGFLQRRLGTTRCLLCDHSRSRFLVVSPLLFFDSLPGLIRDLPLATRRSRRSPLRSCPLSRSHRRRDRCGPDPRAPAAVSSGFHALLALVFGLVVRWVM